MAGDFERATRQGFGFALGAILAAIIVCCGLLLVLVVFSLVAG